MEPIIIRISKAKTVPATKSRYDYRTEWRHVKKITYQMSSEIFKHIGDPERGLKIITDAQFAQWLVDNFGNGRFHLHVFKKGISGWTFYNFDCTSKTRFFQVRKEKSFEQREKEELIRTYRRKTKELEEAESKGEKEEIREEMEEIESEIEVDEILVEDDDKRGKVKIKIFQNTSPLYSVHEYEDYGDKNSEKNKERDNRLW